MLNTSLPQNVNFTGLITFKTGRRITTPKEADSKVLNSWNAKLDQLKPEDIHQDSQYLYVKSGDCVLEHRKDKLSTDQLVVKDTRNNTELSFSTQDGLFNKYLNCVDKTLKPVFDEIIAKLTKLTDQTTPNANNVDSFLP